jgi:hypothetical protein
MTKFAAASCTLSVAGVLVALATSAAAPPNRYQIKVAGVVFDTRTKLTWQQFPVGIGADGGTATTFDYPAASGACQTLSLDGSQWRLPTEAELLTLIDWSAPFPPFIDPTFFPNTPPDTFWSSTPISGIPSDFWATNFGYLFQVTTYAATSQTLDVRCVR